MFCVEQIKAITPEKKAKLVRGIAIPLEAHIKNVVYINASGKDEPLRQFCQISKEFLPDVTLNSGVYFIAPLTTVLIFRNKINKTFYQIEGDNKTYVLISEYPTKKNHCKLDVVDGKVITTPIAHN